MSRPTNRFVVFLAAVVVAWLPFWIVPNPVTGTIFWVTTAACFVYAWRGPTWTDDIRLGGKPHP